MAIRVITGNKNRMPGGIYPTEWAARVFALQDEGYDQDTAKEMVRQQIEEQEQEDDGD